MGYSSQSIGIWTQWTPTLTGWSVEPTIDCRYLVIGKICFFNIQMSQTGTSNSTAKTITMPFVSKSFSNGAPHIILRTHSGTGATWEIGFMNMATNSNIATVYRDALGTNWHASQTCSFEGSGFYEIA